MYITFMQSKVTCIIPARGGSKRLPRKNTLIYRGDPLVVGACKKAIEAQIFDRVIVSTEDSEIVEATRAISGVEIDYRPEHLSWDNVRADEVIRHVIQSNRITNEELVCCLLPTTPKISYHDLQSAIKEFWVSALMEPLFAVIPNYQTPFRSFTLSEGSHLTPLFPEKLVFQSQEYPICVNDAGQFYFALAKDWIKNYSITAAPLVRGLVLNHDYIIDINTQRDWDLFLKLDEKPEKIQRGR